MGAGEAGGSILVANVPDEEEAAACETEELFQE
jgi:hypothetical protein